MTVLSDTHAVLWFLTDDERLSPVAKEIFETVERGEEVMGITTISLLELFYVSKKKGIVPLFDAFLEEIEGGSNYTVYELDMDIVREAFRLELIEEMHDKVIAATARILRVPLITADGNIRQSGHVSVLW